MKTLLTFTVAVFLAAGSMFAASKLTCTLTGKEVKACCCQPQKDGKLLCKLTGRKIDKCCCKGM